MTNMQLTQTQILELINLEIEKCNCNCKEAKDLVQILVDNIGMKKEFEIGKYYKNGSERMMHILGEVNTTTYGQCLVAETSSGDLKPVGQDSNAKIGWTEIDENEWMKNFS